MIDTVAHERLVAATDEVAAAIEDYLAGRATMAAVEAALARYERKTAFARRVLRDAPPRRRAA